ncbi:MAG: lipid II:glycine glycyltransferase FemX [Candidatus Dormibacteria bacterium]
MIAAQTGLGQAAEWDRWLRAWPRANLLQSHSWGAVQDRAGWRTERILVETPGRVLPVTALIGQVGPAALSRLYVPRGPVCGPDDVESFTRVMETLVAAGRARGASVVEVEVPWEAREVPPHHPLVSLGRVRARQPLATSLVDLRPEPEDILDSFHAKTRYNVRLAERKGVDVRRVGLAELSHCIRATEARQGIRLPSEHHLRNVLEILGDGAWALGATVGQEVVAAVLLARFDDQILYLYGGATDRHRQLMPNHLLHWRAMMLARQDGCSSYDLWGVPEDDSPDHPWQGLAQFKRGFGGARVEYSGCWRQELRPLGARLVSLADAARLQLRRRR